MELVTSSRHWHDPNMLFALQDQKQPGILIELENFKEKFK